LELGNATDQKTTMMGLPHGPKR